MKIDIPFFYKARALLSRHQNPKDMLLYASAQFEIEEISETEASIAIKAKVVDNFATDNLQRANYRVYKSNLLSETSTKLGYGKQFTPLNRTSIFTEIEQWKQKVADADDFSSLSQLLQPDYSKVSITDIMNENAVKIKELISSERTQILDELKARFSQSVFVNDTLYVPSDGPCWTNFSWKKRSFYLQREALDLKPQDRTLTRGFYGVYDGQILQETVDQWEPSQEELVFNGKLTILQPRTRSIADDIKPVAEKIITVVRDSLGHMDDQAIDQYQRLRKIVNSTTNSMGDINAISLAKTCLSMIDYWNKYQNTNTDQTLRWCSTLQTAITKKTKPVDTRYPDVLDVSLDDLDLTDSDSFKI